jgi:hypothetical protein
VNQAVLAVAAVLQRAVLLQLSGLAAAQEQQQQQQQQQCRFSLLLSGWVCWT